MWKPLVTAIFSMIIITSCSSCASKIYKKEKIYYPPQVRKKVHDLHQKLASSSWEKRREASRSLIKMGKHYIPLYREYLQRGDLEQQWRMKYVLSELGWIPPGTEKELEKRFRKLRMTGRGDYEILAYGHQALPLLREKIHSTDYTAALYSLRLLIELEDSSQAIFIAKMLRGHHPLHAHFSAALSHLENIQTVPHLAYGLYLHGYYYEHYPFCSQSLINLAGPAAYPFLLDFWYGPASFHRKKRVLEDYLNFCDLDSSLSPETLESPRSLNLTLNRLKKWWKENQSHFWDQEMKSLYQKYQKLKKQEGHKL